MEDPIFVNDKNIPLVTYHDKDVDYDDCDTPNANRVDETTFKRPGSAETTSALWDKVKKWDKIAALYRCLKVNGK